MSRLARYPNQFYQPTPVVTRETSAPAASNEQEERPPGELSVATGPARLETRSSGAPTVPGHSLSVLGLDRWRSTHGTH